MHRRSFDATRIANAQQDAAADAAMPSGVKKKLSTRGSRGNKSKMAADAEMAVRFLPDCSSDEENTEENLRVSYRQCEYSSILTSMASCEIACRPCVYARACVCVCVHQRCACVLCMQVCVCVCVRVGMCSVCATDACV